jgi:hypothetical protein
MDCIRYKLIPDPVRIQRSKKERIPAPGSESATLALIIVCDQLKLLKKRLITTSTMPHNFPHDYSKLKTQYWYRPEISQYYYYVVRNKTVVVGSVSDPDWIRIQSGQWIRFQEGKNYPQK